VADGLDNLTCTLRKVSRGKLRADRAQALYEAAQSSVGVIQGQASIVLEIREILAALEASECFTKCLEQKMVEHLKEIPYSRSILSLKGIGEVTAAGLIGEVGDFRKFSTISEIMKLAGLNLFEISSGKNKGKRRISKRGRPLLRKLLYFAALNTVRKGGVMHQRYQRHLGNGMPKTKALVSVARKLFKIIFALARHNSLYVKICSNVSLKLNEAA
jgi:transposase